MFRDCRRQRPSLPPARLAVTTPDSRLRGRVSRLHKHEKKRYQDRIEDIGNFPHPHPKKLHRIRVQTPGGDRCTFYIDTDETARLNTEAQLRRACLESWHSSFRWQRWRRAALYWHLHWRKLA